MTGGKGCVRGAHTTTDYERHREPRKWSHSMAGSENYLSKLFVFNKLKAFMDSFLFLVCSSSGRY